MSNWKFRYKKRDLLEIPIGEKEKCEQKKRKAEKLEMQIKGRIGPMVGSKERIMCELA
jgi:hypothetical protein